MALEALFSFHLSPYTSKLTYSPRNPQKTSAAQKIKIKEPSFQAQATVKQSSSNDLSKKDIGTPVYILAP